MIFCCLSAGCLSAVYLTCTFTKHLVAATVSHALFYFCKIGKRGIEPPMFTTWELIYSQLQHRQSLPLPRNARTPHSISLYATALRIQYQISSAPSERKDSNLQSGSRCCFPCTRHFYQLSYVPKPPPDG